MYSRRRFITGAGAAGAGLFLGGCAKEAGTKEVTATEDLMREHGVLRRALFVYGEAAARLRGVLPSVPPDALYRTASLFRAFGEEYHEKKLEEAFIFPAVQRAGSPAAKYPDILIVQHQRGREITEYILSATKLGKIAVDGVKPLASALESLVRMYLPHAAIEDTIVFPAWKQALSAGELDRMNDRFEDIEHEQFGADGFEDAVRQIADIEASLGLDDLRQFTAPPPPSL